MSLPDIKVIQDAKVLLQILDEVMQKNNNGLTINIFMVQLSQNNVNGKEESNGNGNGKKFITSKEDVLRALEESDWLQMKAAMKLGCGQATMSRLCKEHGIVHPKWNKRLLKEV